MKTRMKVKLGFIAFALMSSAMFQNFVKIDPNTLNSRSPMNSDLQLLVHYTGINQAIPGNSDVPFLKKKKVVISDDSLHSFDFVFNPELGGFTERPGNNCKNTEKRNPTFVEMHFKLGADTELDRCEFRLNASENYQPCPKGTINLIKKGDLFTLNTDGPEIRKISRKDCPDKAMIFMRAGDRRYLEFRIKNKKTGEQYLRKFSYSKL